MPLIDHDLLEQIFSETPTPTTQQAADKVTALLGFRVSSVLIRVSMHRAGYRHPCPSAGGRPADLDYEFDHVLGGIHPGHRRSRTYYELRAHERVELGLTAPDSIMASAADIRFRNLRRGRKVVDYDPTDPAGFYVRPAYPWESDYLPEPWPGNWRDLLETALDATDKDDDGWTYTPEQVAFYREALADLEDVA